MSNVAGKPHPGRDLSAPWRLAAIVALAASVAAFAAGATALAQVSAQQPLPAAVKIPALGSAKFAWLALGVDWLDAPAGLGRGPIRPDPAHPLHGNRDGPGQVTPHIGNAADPVLKPWAAKQMQASNDEVLSGKRGLPFSAQSTCHPGGVPEQLLTPAEPFYFIQTPSEVWMIWQTDHMVRRVYLTGQHSETVQPSWFGESIGHYEGGDTLVIDTIGITDRSFVDNYRTPHTSKLHVVERFKLVEDGQVVQISMTVDDPGAFTTPWSATQRWRRVDRGAFYEASCNENHTDYFEKYSVPTPRAAKPDF